VWDADFRMGAHLYAGYALELLEHLLGNDASKINGLVIGSPAFRLSTSSAGNPSPTIGGTWILENQIELSADQVQDLVEFLTAQESLLKRISSYDKEAAERAFSKVYQLIAAYGGKVRPRKGISELIENTQPKCQPPHHYIARQLFHCLSSFPDLSCDIKTDQSLDKKRQTRSTRFAWFRDYH
jgi:hypothetical protein